MSKPTPSATEPDETLPPARGRFFWRLLHVLVLLLGLITLLGFAGRLWWVLDLLAHFRVQYLVCAMLAALVYGIGREWRWLAVAAVPLVINGTLMVPFYGFDDMYESDARGQPHSLLVANLSRGNLTPSLAVDWIREASPDLVLLIEVDDAWMQQLAPLRALYPVEVAEPRSNNFGILLLSRLPLVDGGIEALGDAGLPSIVARLQSRDRTFTFVGTHPVPPMAATYAAMRDQQLRAVADRIAGLEGPVVFAGDLNATSWSHPFRELTARTGLRDSREDRGIQATWPTSNPIFRIPIDHILISDEIQILHRSVGPDIASDHFPLHCRFAIRR